MIKRPHALVYTGLCLLFFLIFQPTAEAAVFGNWKLNDNAGNYNVIDSNGGPNGKFEDKNCSGNANNTTSGVSRDGILGRAFCFNASDRDSVETRSGIAGGDTTISIWFNTTTLGVTDTNWYRATGLMSAERASGEDDIGLTLNGSQVLGGVNNCTTNSTTTGLNDGTWHLATLTRVQSTGVFNLYIDGMFESTGTSGMNGLSSCYALGANWHASNCEHDDFFNGLLDDARAYTHVLTAYEIGEMFKLNTVWASDTCGNWTDTKWSACIMPNDINSRAVFSNKLDGCGGTTSGNRTITLNTNATVGALIFDDDNNFTLAGSGCNVITLDVNLYNKNCNCCDYAEITVDTVYGNGAHVIGANLCFGTTVLLTQNSTGDLTLSGDISGTGALIKEGTGTVILSSTANSFTGNITISDGTVALGDSGVIPDANDITLNGGTLSTGVTVGFTETVGNVTLSATSTINLGTGVHTLTLDDLLLGANTLNITGWGGTAGSTGTAGRLLIDTTNSLSGILATDLTGINFFGFANNDW